MVPTWATFFLGTAGCAEGAGVSEAAAGALFWAADLAAAGFGAPVACVAWAGCFCAGFSAGKRQRLHGMLCGSLSALLLAVFWYAVSCITAGALRSPALLCILLPAGAAGGVCGVNTGLPLPKRRTHLPARLHAGTALLLRHRPRKRADANQNM